MGRLPKRHIVWYHDFGYQADSWERPRRWWLKWSGTGESYSPLVGFIMPKLSAKAKVEQWIKEGKYALNWMRLS